MAMQIPLFKDLDEKPLVENQPARQKQKKDPPTRRTKRPVSEGAEKHLDVAHPCLNKGLVRLVDYIGSDERIVQSARVSYGDGTKSVREDKALISYLLRHGHTSPFEQIGFTFHLKMPIFVARQWIRHRMARLNEISGRYSVMRDEFYVPFGHAIRYQSKKNGQGRSDDAVPTEFAVQVMESLTQEHDRVYAQYESFVEKDIARELARINLPLSLYTEMYWQTDLHNLLHFLRLRMDPHAQYEIRVYAEKMAEIVRDAVPMAYEAFEEHILHGRRFSRSEVSVMADTLATVDLSRLRDRLKKKGLKKSRRREFCEKLGFDPDQMEQASAGETHMDPALMLPPAPSD